MIHINREIESLRFTIHRAFILNELTRIAKTHPNPLFLYDDDRLKPHDLKGASNSTAARLDSQKLQQQLHDTTRPVLLATASWQQLDNDTAAKITKSPHVIYTIKNRPGNHPKPKYQSQRWFYSLLSNTKDTAFTIHPYAVIFVLAILLTALSTTGNLIPPDDYARHAKAYQYHYDYSTLYPYSKHPSYDSYILFDLMAGTLHRAFGQDSATFFQVIPFIITMIAVSRLTRPAHNNMTNLVLIATAYFTWQRFQAARPCILMSSLFLLVYAYRDDIGKIPHYLSGLAMAGLYHIFFIYTIPLLIPRKTRIPYLLATITGIAFWMAYSSGNYPADLAGLARTKAQLKALGLEYAELQPIIGPAIFSTFAVMAPLIAYARRDLKKSAVATFFILLNQVRYLETAIPISLSFLQNMPVRVNALAVIAAFAIFLRALIPFNNQPIDLPQHSNVLTYSSALMNSVVSGSDYITISPSPNLPWDDKEIQDTIVKTVKTGDFDCKILDKYPFDHIVEKNFRSIPPCLTLQQITTQARIWVPIQKE